MIKRILFYISGCLMLFISVSQTLYCENYTSEEREWLDMIGALRFSEVDWEPLSYTSAYPQYAGLISDYLNIISQQTGIEMHFVKSRTWQEVLDKFENGEIDLVPALSIDDSVQREVVYTVPFISFPLVIVTNPEIDFIMDTSELNGKKVGVGEGYTSHNFLNANYPDIKLVTTDNVSEGLKLLEKGEIHAFVGHMAVVIDAIKTHGLNLHLAGKTEYVFDHRIGLPAGHERTARIFNRIIGNISPEEHNRIYNRWIKINAGGINYSLIRKILMGSLIIIGLTILWNWRISAKKNEIEKLLKSLQAMKIELEDKNRVLKKLVITDRLTGLYNRVKLDEVLCGCLNLYNRYKQSYSIILMDIDHFKKINDIYGHLTGDSILVEISGLLKSNIRKTDTIGRWGGEEFLIICPNSNREDTEKMAVKLKKEIEKHSFTQGLKVTGSFGISSHEDKDDITSLLKRSDEALYRAKHTGRNKVVTF